MIPESRTTYDDELFPGRGDTRNLPNPIQIYRGVVGWKDDNDHADLGSSGNDGHTFIKVTLNYGKHLSSGDPVEGQAHGFQVLAHTLGPFYWVPPVGTPVLVAFPDGDMEAPGAAVILGSLSGTPLVQFGKNGAKIDLGPNQNFTIKARRITLMDYENRFMSIGIDSNIVLQTAEGTGMFISDLDGISMYVVNQGLTEASTLFNLKSDKIRLIQKDSGYLSIENGNASLFANKIAWLNGATVYVGGSISSPPFPALYGTSPGPGTPSKSVFIGA